MTSVKRKGIDAESPRKNVGLTPWQNKRIREIMASCNQPESDVLRMLITKGLEILDTPETLLERIREELSFGFFGQVAVALGEHRLVGSVSVEGRMATATLLDGRRIEFTKDGEAALLDERVVIATVGALSNLHTSASPVRGEEVAASDNPTPVLCPECGWCGRADELGPEGECGGEDGCAGFPGEITDHADLIHAWLDSEGMVAGRQCADAGLIEPHPATEDEAERLDIAPGDSVRELTEAGRAALDALRSRQSGEARS